MAYTYAQVKTHMQAAGYPVSAGSGWTAVDQGNFELFMKSAAYGQGGQGGQNADRYGTNYGFAYPAAAPTWFANYISSGTP